MVISFTRQLYILIKAGIPLLKALQIIAQQLPSGKFKNTVEAVVQDIHEGKSFSESLGNTSGFFSLFYVNMIKAAEVTGNLTGILKDLSENLIRQRRIVRQVQSAFMYPILVLVVCIFILVALLMVVIPVFTRIFADLGGTLPPATLFLIGLSKATTKWGWLILLLIATIIAAIVFASKKSQYVRKIINIVAWYAPIFGKISMTIEIGRFCRTLGTLLSSGVTLVKGLDVLIETTPGVLVRSALENIRVKVEQGDTLSAAMEETKIFPLTLVKMIQVGEESGKIADLFLDAAEDYEDEVSYAVTGLLSLLEPVLIVVMGGIVGFIVIALFFPIFTISSLVK